MNGKTVAAVIFYVVSLVFFVLGMTYPIMSNDVLMGLISEKSIYIIDSVMLFFDKGEVFLGCIILLFSLIFPILKYLVIGLKIAYVRFPGDKQFAAVLDFINKWAMLDVFVVALVIINMKMGHGTIISTNVEVGTSFFAASIVLLMVSNWILKRRIIGENLAVIHGKESVEPLKEEPLKSTTNNGDNPDEIS